MVELGEALPALPGVRLRESGEAPSLCPEASSISHTMWSYMSYSSVLRSSSEPSGSPGWSSFHRLTNLGSNSRHAGEGVSRVSVNRGRSAASASTGDTLLSGWYRRCTSSRGRERRAGSGKNRTRNVSWSVGPWSALPFP